MSVIQPGFGFQQPLVPGMRPGTAQIPNLFMPLVPQAQPAQRPPGARRAGQQAPQHPLPLGHQQVQFFYSLIFRVVNWFLFDSQSSWKNCWNKNI